MMPGDSPNIQVPYALSLIVCDAVITDQETGKPSIIGCFTSISALTFPTLHPRMTVFAELTDGKGEIPIQFRLVDVDEEIELFSADVTVPMEDPLVVGRMVFRTPPISFPFPGEYRLQLFAAGEPLMERRILLVEVRKESHEERKSDE